MLTVFVYFHVAVVVVVVVVVVVFEAKLQFSGALNSDKYVSLPSLPKILCLVDTVMGDDLLNIFVMYFLYQTLTHV